MKVDKTKWEKSLFKNCVTTIKVKKAIQKNNYLSNGKYPIISQEKEFISGYCNNKKNLNQGLGEVVIFGDHTRILKFIDFDFCVGADGVKVLHPLNFIRAKYLYYFLKWIDIPSNGYSRHFKYLKEITIPYPSVNTQQNITTELDTVQKMIEGYKAQLADLDTLGQSIFLDMFGDVVNNERKWNFVKFGSLTSSINYGTSAPAVDGGKYKYLRMGNITDNGHLDFQDIKYIDIPDNEIAKYIVHKGDILFNRTNSREKVGKTACFMEEEEMIIAGYIIRIRLNEEKSLPLYIAQAFNTPEMKSYLRRLARGSVGQANINSKELSDIKISVPPLPLQQQFAERVEAIERQKELLQAQLAEAQTLMAERMQYYFD